MRSHTHTHGRSDTDSAWRHHTS